MKLLPFIIIMFIVLIVCIAVNAFFIYKVSDFISNTANLLLDKNGREENIAMLENYWERKKGIIGLSVDDDEIDKTESIIICLRAAHNAQNEEDFQKCVLQLKNAATSIKRKEQMSISNIF